MKKVFASPSKYVQGKTILVKGISYIKNLDNEVLLLRDDSYSRVPFNEEASTAEINRVNKISKVNQFNLVIGLCGSKKIDASTISLLDIYSDKDVFGIYILQKKS